MSGRTKSTELTEEFLEEKVVLRGTTYTFREITGEQYEEVLKMAEGPDGNADLSTVLRLMIPLSMIEPKISAEALYRKPLPVVTAIQGVVNRMHFRTEPTAAPVEEGESPGNDSEAPTS